MEPIRILQIVGGMNMGGIENFIMNVYRNIDRTKVQFDFFIHNDVDAIFEREIKELGGKIFKIPHITKSGHIRYMKNVRKFFKEHKEYQIIHSHYNEMSGFILKIANKEGVKIKIAHSHSAYPKYNSFLEKLYKCYSISLINKNSNLKFACSKIAGEWLYGKKEEFNVINNGIDSRKYIYNENIRKNKREELKINDNEIVIGHVGRLNHAKNHKFILEIFHKLLQLNFNYKLLLVGKGELENEILEKIKELKLEEKVMMLGVRKDVNELMQAFDFLLFPSIFEGLPVTLVESQGTGLKAFVSDVVTKEIDFNCGLIEFISLNKDAEYWADKINKNDIIERKDTSDTIKKYGYDVASNANILQEKYIELYQELTNGEK